MNWSQRLIAVVRVFRPVYTPLLHLLFMLLWLLPLLHRFSPFRPGSKRVLLITQNVIALDHMRDIDSLLNEYTSVSRFATTDWLPARGVGRRDIEAVIDAPYIHVLTSLLQYWDLIIFTNHPFGAGIWFSPLIKKLYVNHGIHVGKINNSLEQDGVYGRSRVIRLFNQPFYTRMFAASEYERDLALRATPDLSGRISVTGYPRADKLIENEGALRKAGRSRLGCAIDDKVVHIISTWGEHSLIDSVGDVLLEQVKSLRERYKFILSLHPRYDEFNKRGAESRNDILRRWEAVGVHVDRGTGWEEYVASADVAVSDHSSLGLYHVLLNHPMVLVDIAQEQYILDSTFSLMKQRLPVLTRGGDLESLLLQSMSTGHNSDLALVSERMLSCRGKALFRYREEISGLLGLKVEGQRRGAA
jgi:hypothetical protein